VLDSLEAAKNIKMKFSDYLDSVAELSLH
jgi:hypothetical protein